MFPSILKGSDLYLYCVFVALGLKVRIRPVMERKASGDRWEDDDEPDEAGDEYYVGKFRCGTGAVETDRGGYDDDSVEDTYAEFGHRESVHWLNAPDRSTRQVGFYHLAVRFFPLLWLLPLLVTF